jgi:hypothetical protein
MFLKIVGFFFFFFFGFFLAVLGFGLGACWADTLPLMPLPYPALEELTPLPL